jgi:hypothetical protein
MTPEISPVVPDVTLMVASPLRETVPENFPPPLKKSAPYDKYPVPAIVSGSAELVTRLPTFNDAPLATVVPWVAPLAPRPALFDRFKSPSLTAVVPVYVFVPESVSAPAPVFVNVPLPEMTPDNVTLVTPLSTLMVVFALSEIVPDAVTLEVGRFSAPSVDDTPSPASVRGSLVDVVIFNVAPDDTDVPPAFVPSAVEPPAVSVPALTVVVPVYVLAPLKLRAPVPVFVRFVDVPAMMPAYVSVAPELTSIVPCDAPSVIPRFVERVKVEDACNVPPFKVIDVALTEPGAAPRLRSAATDKVPAVTDTPPELEFVADNVRVPAPDFVTAPEPDMIPDTVADCPDATWTVAADDSATVPVTVPPAVKFNAPADDTPVPARLSGSAIE